MARGGFEIHALAALIVFMGCAPSVAAPGTDDKGGEPSVCEPWIDEDLKAYIRRAEYEGWQAVHEERGLRSLDVTRYASRAEWAELAPVYNLGELGFESQYWARSSPDGRYVAAGDCFRKGKNGDGYDCVAGANGYYGVVVRDLQEGATLRVHGNFDPVFMPDGSGLVALVRSGGYSRISSIYCPLSAFRQVLELGPGPEYLLDMADEPISDGAFQACAAMDGIEGEYQQIGSSVGGDQYVVTGPYMVDLGGGFLRHVTTLDNPLIPSDDRQDASQNHWGFEIQRMGRRGLGFEPIGRATSVPIVNELDVGMSPSSRLVSTRSKTENAAGDRQTSQRIYLVSDSGLKPVGRVCGESGFANFSYNERFIAYHRYGPGPIEMPDLSASELASRANTGDDEEEDYVAPEEPLTTEVQQNRGRFAQVYIADLCTGREIQVTNVPLGHYAVFPHFRADGWLYFLVKDELGSKEWIMASDVALTQGDTGTACSQGWQP